MEKWFDALSMQLATLIVGNWPQNCRPNPCYVEVEVDCNVEKEDQYIQRFGAIHQDYLIHQFMTTILKRIVNGTRLDLMETKSYTNKVILLPNTNDEASSV